MSKDLLNEAYDALLVTIGVVSLSMLTKKFAGGKLTSANNLTDFGKLAAGVTASTILVKYAKEYKFVPDDPFNKT